MYQIFDNNKVITDSIMLLGIILSEHRSGRTACAEKSASKLLNLVDSFIIGTKINPHNKKALQANFKGHTCPIPDMIGKLYLIMDFPVLIANFNLENG